MKKSILQAALFTMVMGTLLSANSPAITGWFKAGDKPKSYEMKIDNVAGPDGKPAATIKSIDKRIDGFGTLMQDCKPDEYLGKRVRMTGYMKSDSVSEWAGFWFRVDGATINRSLSFDNMVRRPVKGTTGWKRYEIVLDVPSTAKNLAYGVLISGTGQIWFTNIAFVIVDRSVKTTGWEEADSSVSLRKGPVNLNFDSLNKIKYWYSYNEVHDWSELFYSKNKHDIPIEKGKGQDGKNAAHIKVSPKDTGSYCALVQRFDPVTFRGKRVKMTGYMKSQNVAGKANFWFTVNDEISNTSYFDSMRDRVVKGTTNWTKYELVIDVPANATMVNFGAGLKGTGDIWVSDLSFEVVDNSVKTTSQESVKDSLTVMEPTNLDFSK